MNPIRPYQGQQPAFHIPESAQPHGSNAPTSARSSNQTYPADLAPSRNRSVAMPSKVRVGGDSFLIGTLRSRLDAQSRAYLRTALNPDENTPTTQRQDGIVSYLVQHETEENQTPGPDVLAVSVDVDQNKYLKSLVAARVSDRETVLDLRFDSKLGHFAEKLISGLRSKTADNVQASMLKNGPKWYWELESGEDLTLKKLSAENIDALRSDVNAASLKDYEKAFIKSLIDEPLYITHAAPSDADIKRPDGTVSLFSRRKLEERQIEFNTENTTDHDIAMLANDDHVFFSLEAGDQPQKDSSRFGDKLVRFKFDQPKILSHATLHLVDPLTAVPPSVGSRFDAIEDHMDEEEAADAIDKLESRAFTPGEATFHGRHMKIGLALSIIQTCRNSMPDDMSRELLEGESVNRVMNGLFRPTVMVPRHFFDKPVDESDILIN